MLQNLTTQIITLLLAATPISLGVIYLIHKLLHKNHKNFQEVSVITTGTFGVLTEQDLTVRSLIFDKYRIDIHKKDEQLDIFDHETLKHTKIDKKEIKNHESLVLMAKIISFCRYPKIEAQEKTIKNFFSTCEINLEKFFKEHRLLDQLPVIEGSKISSAVVLETETEEIYAFCKGHPLTILEKCRRILISGKKIDLTPKLTQKLKKKINNQLNSGHKLIAFAYKALPRKRYGQYEHRLVENDLIFVGIAGLGHFIKTDLKEPLKELRRLGIKIYLNSDEPENKTHALAREMGILKVELEDLNHETVIKSDPEKLPLPLILEKIKKARSHKLSTSQIWQHALIIKILLVSLLLPAFILNAPLPFTILPLLIIELAIFTPLQLSLQQNKKAKHQKKFTKILRIFLLALLLNLIYYWQLARFGWQPGIELSSEISLQIASKSAIFLIITYAIYLAHQINHTRKININLYLTSLLALIIAFYL